MSSTKVEYAWGRLKYFALPVVAVLVFWALCASDLKSGAPVDVQAPESLTRFEELFTQRTDVNSQESIVVWHDKDGGQEIACYHSGGGHVSCWPTGRNWR